MKTKESIISIIEEKLGDIEYENTLPQQLNIADVRVSTFIICAAIWYNDGKERHNLPRNIKTGIVVGGWRHGNCITMLHEMFPNRDYILNNKDDKTTIQGFLTSKGMFVDREEAGKIAFEAKQISAPNDYLFSEDLY